MNSEIRRRPVEQRNKQGTVNIPLIILCEVIDQGLFFCQSRLVFVLLVVKLLLKLAHQTLVRAQQLVLQKRKRRDVRQEVSEAERTARADNQDQKNNSRTEEADNKQGNRAERADADLNIITDRTITRR